MSFRERSEGAAQAVLSALAASATEEQTKEITAIIEKAVIDAVAEANQRCAQVATTCCSADQDLAHKISNEIHRAHKALIANLSSLR